jgi:hypothetical protein
MSSVLVISPLVPLVTIVFIEAYRMLHEFYLLEVLIGVKETVILWLSQQSIHLELNGCW